MLVLRDLARDDSPRFGRRAGGTEGVIALKTTFEVWVLTEKGHVAYQWTQYFCDSREVALQKVEEWLGKAEKIEVKPA